ncbi:uncharacterized protein PITG_16299 [Phytophthora infestans T30-4]|uniref:Helicase C-terminal domain-containing protein n=1 Tax=Phytophthora infestans (strain T30-4) TaxID=403677 RepID=D0NTY4_PHYIT|nr:uncharacterized protein PITG_16299 [Phytophthora infestans T30-4]EEY65108.1 conserved hypothetical protein [Phytophthora infestans T30-4]|eukprot:XP_002897365.1 conserved hypothetical protein [Phytophthora infestans T30-4]
MLGEDETTSVEVASPPISYQDRDIVDEETDEYGRVLLGSIASDKQETSEGCVWIAKEIKPLLKPHQVEGVQFLHSHVAAGRGCILADYMGLGKTLQVITVIYSYIADEIDARKRRSIDATSLGGNTNKAGLKEAGEPDKNHEDEEPPVTVLVLCPAICLPNWDSEFQKWLGTDARARCPVLTLDSSTTKAYAALLQVMNHPDIIYSKLCPSQGDGSALLLEDDECTDALDDSSGWAWESEERLQEKRQIAAAQRRRKRQKLTDTQKSYEWARSVIFGNDREVVVPSVQPMASAYHTQVLENSGKMAVLLRIVEESFACGDKVVIFSQSVPTLKVISNFLRASAFSPSRVADDAANERKRLKNSGPASKPKRRRVAPRPNRDPAGILRKRRNQAGAKSSRARKTGTVAAVSNVTSNEWFLQIDGSTHGSKRMEYIQRFTSPDSPVKLLLVSTRAGAEGINLHAANRLVLFDVSWNPSNDHQSMCRSHRIGQAKTVHVYRLVSTGTMERRIYEQQMKKVDLSTSVVDSHERVGPKEHAVDVSSMPAAAKEEGTSLVPYSGFLQPPTETDKELVVDEGIAEDDGVLASCVKQLGRWIVGVDRVHVPVEDEKQDVA